MDQSKLFHGHPDFFQTCKIHCLLHQFSDLCDLKILMNELENYIDNFCMCIFTNCKAMLNFCQPITHGGS